MPHKDHLHAAWKGFLGNPSMLAVLVLEFLLFMLVGVLFVMLSMSLVSPGQAGLAAVISFLQFLIFLILDAYVKAGFFGMAKNTLQDGSTTIREFFPNAKRYWKPMLGSFLIMFGLLFVFGIPFVASTMTQQSAEIVLATLLFLVVSSLVVVLYWFLWVPAEIVYNDVGVLDAIRHTLATAVVTALVITLAFFATEAFTRPLASLEPTPTLFYVGILVELIVVLIFSVATVIVTLYVFGRWSEKS